MPLIDTNWLLQVQVDSEVNSDLSQVLVEDWSGSRPGHGPLTENEGIIVLKKSYWAVPMGQPLRPPARSVGWPLRPRPAQNLKLQGNEYFQWKQRVLRSNLVRIINLHVLFSTDSLVFNCFRCILQIESLWMTIVAMLFSKGQFNVSGRCCRNVVVDQQDTNALIESTRWCLSNRQVGVDWMAFNSKDHLQVLEAARKRNKNNCWRLLQA